MCAIPRLKVGEFKADQSQTSGNYCRYYMIHVGCVLSPSLRDPNVQLVDTVSRSHRTSLCSNPTIKSVSSPLPSIN